MSWFVPAFDLWLNVTLAGLALAAVAALAVLLVREPARKIRVIQLALVGLLALPALALLPGYPRVAWWPAPTVTRSSGQPPALPEGSFAAPLADQPAQASNMRPPAEPGATNAPLIDQSAPSFATLPAGQPADEPAPSFEASHTGQPSALPADSFVAPPADETAHAITMRPPAEQGATTATLPDYRVLLLAAYAAGVGLFALWWLLGRLALLRLVRHATPAEPHLRALLNDIAVAHAAGPAPACVRLLVSPRAAQPCACGWLRPTIVLPLRVVNELNPDQLRLALSHEWSHVARGDIRTWMLAGLVRLVYFHLPPVWLLRRELRVSQDYLADAAAASDATPEDYAELLTTLSRMFRPTSLSPGLGIAPRHSDLYRRVIMLVDRTRPLERTIPRRWNVAAIALGVALVAGVATLRAEPEPTEPTSAPADAAPLETPTAEQPPALPEGSSSPSVAAPEPSSDVEPSHATVDATNTADRGAIAVQLINSRKQLETLLKVRKQLEKQLGQESIDANREGIKDQLEVLDKGCFELSQKVLELESQFAATSPPSPYAAAEPAVQSAVPETPPVKDGETPAGKRRLLGALLAELNQLATLREEVGKRVAEQTDPTAREPLEAQIRTIEIRRIKAIQRIYALLKSVDSHGSSSRASEAGEPSLDRTDPLIEELVEYEPDVRRLRREFRQRLDTLNQLTLSEADPQEIEKARRSIGQISEQIDEVKLRLIPDLLNAVAALEGGVSGSESTSTETRPKNQPPATSLTLSLPSARPTSLNVLLEEDQRKVKRRREALVQRASALQIRLRHVTSTREQLEKDPTRKSPADTLAVEQLRAEETQLSREFDECSAQIHEIPMIPGDKLAIEITRKGSAPERVDGIVRPDGNLVLAPLPGSIHYYVAGKTQGEVSGMINEQLKQLKVITADEPPTVMYAGHEDSIATQAKLPVRPDLLANMMLENDPQIAELKRSLAQKQGELDRQRSSGAPADILKTTQRDVLQLEETIEELKAARRPALLKLIAAANETRGQPAPEERQAAAGSQPFSGRIRPGDILGIELVGGFPTPLAPTRTVEPDGNLALGPIYGPASRVKVAGMTLIEAGQEMEKQLRAVLREPKVMLTYEGHNDGVVAEGRSASAAPTFQRAAEPVVLQPLDTIEIILPLARPRLHMSTIAGRPAEVFSGDNPKISGTYVIEPDGRVALPDAGGRVKLAGLTEEQASSALREHLSTHVFPRIALPTTRVLRRGRAVFADGKQPGADYKIQPGDTILMSSSPQAMLAPTVIDAEGNVQNHQLHVAGMTLEEAQAAARQELTAKDVGFAAPENYPLPWLITIGGWREDADPQVIDLIEGNDAAQLHRMQEELQKVKAMLHDSSLPRVDD